MASKQSRYYNYVFVLLIAISLWALPQTAVGNVSYLQDYYGPPEKVQLQPANYSLIQKSQLHLASVHGELIKRHPDDTREGMLANLQLGYGRLFSSTKSGYLGFGYLTAKLDNDNRLRFNASLGHFLPKTNGELFFTYRFLQSSISGSLEDLGSIQDKVYENSISVNYTRFTSGFLKETSFNYSFSAIPGQECAQNIIVLDPGESGYTAKIIGGFGNTITHEVSAGVAFGSENIGLKYLSGTKTSFQLGYEHVIHDAYHEQPRQIMESLSTLISLEQQTAAGLVKASYKHLDSSRTLSLAYSFKGVELYVKKIQYNDQSDTQLYGFNLQFDLETLKNPFYNRTSLFRKATYCYRDLDQMRHNESINSDYLITQPTMQETISEW